MADKNLTGGSMSTEDKYQEIKTKLIEFFSGKLDRPKDSFVITINEEDDNIIIKLTISFDNVNETQEKRSEEDIKNIAKNIATSDGAKTKIKELFKDSGAL